MSRNLEYQTNFELLSSPARERILELLFNDSPDIIVFLATDLTLETVNHSFVLRTGLTAAQAIGKAAKTLFPDLNKRLEYFLQKSRITKEPVSSKPNLRLTFDCRVRWQVTVNPVFAGEELSGWWLIFKESSLNNLSDLERENPDRAQPPPLEPEKIYQAINGLIPYGIWECDLTGAVISSSRNFLKNTGLTWEETRGYGWVCLAAAETRTKLISEWQECFKQETGWNYQFQLRDSNGVERTIISQALPVRDQEERIISWMVLNSDFTRYYREREADWKTVQFWREFFDTVTNQAAIGLAMYSGDGWRLRWSNPAFQGLVEEAEQAKTAAGVGIDHDLPYLDNLKIEDLVAQVIAEKIPLTDLRVEFHNPLQKQRTFWRMGIIPIWGSFADIPEVLLTALNITPLNYLDDLRESQGEKECDGAALDAVDWEAVADQLSEGLIVLDQTGELAAVNHQAVELLGISPDATFTGTGGSEFAPLSQIYLADGTELAPEEWPHLRALRGEAVNHYEVELRAVGQTNPKYLRFDSVTLRGRDHHRDLVVLTCLDISGERKLARTIAGSSTQEQTESELIKQLTDDAPQIATLTTQLNAATNMFEILKTTLHGAVQALKAVDGGVCLFDGREDYQEAYEVWRDEGALRQLNLNEMPNAKLALQTKKSVYFTQAEAAGQEKAWFDENGIMGCLATPLFTEEQHCIGMMHLHFAQSEAAPVVVDQELAAVIASKCAVVINQAQIHLERSRLLIRERRARVRAERQAAELSALLQSLREGVLVIDATGKILLRNKMERTITRVPDEAAFSILDYGAYRLLTPDGSPLAVPSLPGNRLLRGETLNDTELIMEHSDGSRLNIICSGSVIRGEDGQIVLGILVTRDISEIRQLEDSREAFIRTVSHDLRNPLTVVSARSQLLQRRLAKHNLSTESEEAGIIYTSARRMTQMIQEMFDSYRLEANNLKLKKTMLDLAAVITDLRSRIGSEEDLNRLQIEIIPGDYRIFVDEERIERAVTNLIGNALKYSPSDRPVQVKLLSRANQIVLSVTDFGIGIENRDIPKVFDRYYRSRNAKELAGLGLGLYIVKLIVEAHDGTIDVVSRVGQGSTFTISLPVLTEANGK
jgi:PAS domain S-box-containing protein